MINSFLVGYDVTFNTYEWYRPPKLHKNIILDNHDVAIEAYNDCLKKSAEHKEAMVALARLYQNIGNNEACSQFCNKLLKIDPSNE